MSKSGFKPPQLKDKNKWYCLLFHTELHVLLPSFCSFFIRYLLRTLPYKDNELIKLVTIELCYISDLLKYENIHHYRSQTFQHFIKVALTKNPKKRPTADKLLEVCTSCEVTVFINYAFQELNHLLFLSIFKAHRDYFHTIVISFLLPLLFSIRLCWANTCPETRLESC